MLTTFDRYMREFRAKRTQAKYEREDTHLARNEAVCSASLMVIMVRKAVKDSCRGIES